jgi:hypothetical protein
MLLRHLAAEARVVVRPCNENMGSIGRLRYVENSLGLSMCGVMCAEIDAGDDMSIGEPRGKGPLFALCILVLEKRDMQINMRIISRCESTCKSTCKSFVPLQYHSPLDSMKQS